MIDQFPSAQVAKPQNTMDVYACDLFPKPTSREMDKKRYIEKTTRNLGGEKTRPFQDIWNSVFVIELKNRQLANYFRRTCSMNSLLLNFQLHNYPSQINRNNHDLQYGDNRIICYNTTLSFSPSWNTGYF